MKSSLELVANPLGRRGLIGRLAVATLTASMANVLAARRAQASCPPPGQCYGLDGCYCHGGGCTPGPSGGCCWAWTDTITCRSYNCCDETCQDSTTGICQYLACYCC